MKKLVRKSVTWLLIFGMVFTPLVTSIDLVSVNAEAGETKITVTDAVSDAIDNAAKAGSAEVVIVVASEAAINNANDAEKVANAAGILEGVAKDVDAAVTGNGAVAGEITDAEKDLHGEDNRVWFFNVHTPGAVDDVNAAIDSVNAANGLIEAEEKAADKAETALGNVEDAIGNAKDELDDVDPLIETAKTAKTDAETAKTGAETAAKEALAEAQKKLEKSLDSNTETTDTTDLEDAIKLTKEASEKAVEVTESSLSTVKAALEDAKKITAEEVNVERYEDLEGYAVAAEAAAARAQAAADVAKGAVEAAQQKEAAAEEAVTAAEDAMKVAIQDMLKALGDYQKEINRINKDELAKANSARADVVKAMEEANAAIEDAKKAMNGEYFLFIQTQKGAAGYVSDMNAAAAKAEAAIVKANAALNKANASIGNVSEKADNAQEKLNSQKANLEKARRTYGLAVWFNGTAVDNADKAIKAAEEINKAYEDFYKKALENWADASEEDLKNIKALFATGKSYDQLEKDVDDARAAFGENEEVKAATAEEEKAYNEAVKNLPGEEQKASRLDSDINGEGGLVEQIATQNAIVVKYTDEAKAALENVEKYYDVDKDGKLIANEEYKKLENQLKTSSASGELKNHAGPEEQKKFIRDFFKEFTNNTPSVKNVKKVDKKKEKDDAEKAGITDFTNLHKADVKMQLGDLNNKDYVIYFTLVGNTITILNYDYLCSNDPEVKSKLDQIAKDLAAYNDNLKLKNDAADAQNALNTLNNQLTQKQGELTIANGNIENYKATIADLKNPVALKIAEDAKKSADNFKPKKFNEVFTLGTAQASVIATQGAKDDVAKEIDRLNLKVVAEDLEAYKEQEKVALEEYSKASKDIKAAQKRINKIKEELNALQAKIGKADINVEDLDKDELERLNDLKAQLDKELAGLKKYSISDMYAYRKISSYNTWNFGEFSGQLVTALLNTKKLLDNEKEKLEFAKENRETAEKNYEQIINILAQTKDVARGSRNYIGFFEETHRSTGGGEAYVGETTVLPVAGAAMTGVAGVRRAIGGGRRVAAAGEGTGEEVKTDAGKPKLVPLEEEEVKEEEKAAEKTQKTTTIEEDPLPAAAAAPEKAPFPWWLLLIVVAALGAGYAGYKYYDKKKNEDKIA